MFDPAQLHSLRHQMLLKCWQKCSVLEPFNRSANLDIVKQVFDNAHAELEQVLYHDAVAVVPTAQAPSTIQKVAPTDPGGLPKQHPRQRSAIFQRTSASINSSAVGGSMASLGLVGQSASFAAARDPRLNF